MPERNICHDLGCKGICCGNDYGYVPVSKEWFLKAFPRATEVHSEEDTLEKIQKGINGVYYFADRGWLYFSISGICPNLSEDSECRIHNQRFLPRFCVNMIPDSAECHEAQRIYEKNLQKAKLEADV
jgi:hypothetical protein